MSMSPEKNRFKITRRHRHALTVSTAAAALVVGLGAFGMLPPVQQLQKVAVEAPLQLAQNTPRANPRMMDANSPYSFADLFERVSPAVVTITSEGVSREPTAED